MSIQEAILNATKDILSSYLATELVDQLSDDIMQRAAPDIEAALNEFAGFDLSKSTAGRAKGAGMAAPRKSVTRTARKRKETTEGDTADDVTHDMQRDNLATEGLEPSPDDMA